MRMLSLPLDLSYVSPLPHLPFKVLVVEVSSTMHSIAAHWNDRVPVKTVVGD